ncbi:MAG: cobyric acid synthase CobQ, partial [Pseudomonadota bacterium]
EPGISVEIVPAGRALPGDADLVLLPGSKSTIGDLAYFRAQGWDIDLYSHVRRGGHVIGLCGGYQMLGNTIYDPDGVDGTPGRVDGLGLLDVDTVMVGKKRVTLSTAHALPGKEPINGYEIHMGRTQGADCARAWLELDGRPEGAASADGRILGCYLHGIFSSDAFRSRYLERLGVASDTAYEDGVDQTLNDLADHLERHMDLDRLLALAKPPKTG